MLYQSLLDNDITRIATIRQSVVFFLMIFKRILQSTYTTLNVDMKLLIVEFHCTH
jgi:hypothetical protein